MTYVQRHLKRRAHLSVDERERTCSCGFTFNTREKMLQHILSYSLEAREREHRDPERGEAGR